MPLTPVGDGEDLLLPAVTAGGAGGAVLGYSQGEINLALKGIDLDSLTLEEIIKAALKKMMKG